jgi:hypothetical protein
MPLDTPGAVLLLEARVNARTRVNAPAAIDGRLAEVRLLLESSVGSAEWSPAGGPGVSGTLTLADPAEAFPLLHRLRTELRADPEQPPIALACGMGRGDEVEGGKLAAQAFTSLSRKRDGFTRALTADEDTNVVLGALCRTLDSLHGGWTRAQWQAVHRRDGGRTLQEIGQELGIAYQNVSKRLIAARYSLYRDVLAAASLVFEKTPVPVA